MLSGSFTHLRYVLWFVQDTVKQGQSFFYLRFPHLQRRPVLHHCPAQQSHCRPSSVSEVGEELWFHLPTKAQAPCRHSIYLHQSFCEKWCFPRRKVCAFSRWCFIQKAYEAQQSSHIRNPSKAIACMIMMSSDWGLMSMPARCQSNWTSTELWTFFWAR